LEITEVLDSVPDTPTPMSPKEKPEKVTCLIFGIHLKDLKEK